MMEAAESWGAIALIVGVLFCAQLCNATDAYRDVELKRIAAQRCPTAKVSP